MPERYEVHPDGTVLDRSTGLEWESAARLDEALRFAKTYRAWRGRLHKGLDDVSGLGSDDTFGDLCDALPVAVGREFCTAAAGGDYESANAVWRAVKSAASSDAWHAFAKGEWYVASSLDDKASYFYAHHALREGGPELPGMRKQGWPDAPAGTPEAVEAALDALREGIEAILPIHADKAALALREFRCYVRTLALRDAEAREKDAQARLEAAKRDAEAAKHAAYSARCALSDEERRA